MSRYPLKIKLTKDLPLKVDHQLSYSIDDMISANSKKSMDFG